MFKNKKTGKSLHQELQQQSREMRKLIHKDLPAKAEEELLLIVDQSFKSERYVDKQSSKWKARKGEKRSNRNGRRGLLVKDGNLSGGFATQITGLTVKLTNPMPYATVHNEGLKAGRGKGFTMPQRQFAPIQGRENRTLTKRLYKYLDKESDKILNR